MCIPSGSSIPSRHQTDQVLERRRWTFSFKTTLLGPYLSLANVSTIIGNLRHMQFNLIYIKLYARYIVHFEFLHLSNKKAYCLQLWCRVYQTLSDNQVSPRGARCEHKVRLCTCTWSSNLLPAGTCRTEWCSAQRASVACLARFIYLLLFALTILQYSSTINISTTYLKIVRDCASSTSKPDVVQVT